MNLNPIQAIPAPQFGRELKQAEVPAFKQLVSDTFGPTDAAKVDPEISSFNEVKGFMGLLTIMKDITAEVQRLSQKFSERFARGDKQVTSYHWIKTGNAKIAQELSKRAPQAYEGTTIETRVKDGHVIVRTTSPNPDA